MGTLVHEDGVQQLQALHGLQERHHVRRRDAGEQLHARARARRDADRARRERRAGVPAAAARCAKMGITGPEGHPLSRPPDGRGRGREPRHRASPTCWACRSTSCTCRASSRLEAIARARARGQRVYGEVLAGHLVIDDSVYRNPDFATRGRPRDEPAVPAARATRRRCGAACRPGNLHTTATDHCVFCAPQKAAGKDDFTQDPQRLRRHRGPHGGASGTPASTRAA